MRARSNGFTLTELLVVITILGVLTVSIVPYVSGSMGAVALSSTARELVACTRIAQSRAVTAGVAVRLVVDEQSGKYRVEERRRQAESGGASASSAGATGASGRTLFTPVRDLPGASGSVRPGVRVQVRQYQGVSLAADSTGRSPRASSPPPPSPPAESSTAGQPQGQSILFRPDGTTERREFILRDRDGFGLRLRLLHATGRVEIERLPRELGRPDEDPLLGGAP